MKKKFKAVKDEILDEIRTLLGNGKRHEFKEFVTIHYVDGHGALEEICKAVEAKEDGSIVFRVTNDNPSCQDNPEIMEGEMVYGYEEESFMDILENLKRELVGFDYKEINKEFQELLKKHDNDNVLTNPKDAEYPSFGKENIVFCNAWRELCERHEKLEDVADWYFGACLFKGFDCDNPWDVFVYSKDLNL